VTAMIPVEGKIAAVQTILVAVSTNPSPFRERIMVRIRLLLAALVVVVSTSTVAHAQIEKSKYCTEEAQFNSLEAVVRITLGFDGKLTLGSGCCVGGKNNYLYILSCAHVLETAANAKSTKIDFFTKAKYPNPERSITEPFTFWLDKDKDLALIKVPMTGKQRIFYICPEDVKLKWNIPVLCVGCGYGGPPVCQVGKLIAQDNRDDFVVDRGGIGGRSGGAVIAAQGLIGIHARGSDDRSYAVNFWKIHQFLNNLNHGWLLKREPTQSQALNRTGGLLPSNLMLMRAWETI
jgi:hypothetical protein